MISGFKRSVIDLLSTLTKFIWIVLRQTAMIINNTRIITLVTICHVATPCFATNFNDGIDPGGPINDTIRREINPEFISQKVNAATRLREGKVISSDENSVGIGNIIIGPKANLKGAIIINKSKNNGAAAIAK